MRRLFIHAALGTLAVFLVNRAEEAAHENVPLPDRVLKSVSYLLIFLLFLILEWLYDRYQGGRPIVLDKAGRIDGSWLEALTEPGTQDLDMGSFVKITSSASEGFTITGESFRRDGTWAGHFEGSGQANPEDPRELFYTFAGVHLGGPDRGVGHCRFHRTLEGSATAFDGLFYGEHSMLLRRIAGKRVGDLDHSLSGDARLKKMSEAVIRHLG